MKKSHLIHTLPLIIGMIGAFAFMHVYSVQAILPILIAEFHATDVQAGLSVGAAVMGMAITSPFMGMLSDALGRKWLIILSLFLLIIPTVFIAHAQTIEMLTFWRFVQGIAVPGITVTLLAYIGEEFRGQVMAKLMFFYVSGTVLGGFSGRFLLGHLSEWLNWRLSMEILAALNLIGLILVWKILPPSRHFSPKPLRSAGKMLKNHLHNRYLLSACALGFGVLFSLVGAFTFINLHLAAPPFFLTSGQLANIFAVYLIGMIITPWSAWLIKRFAAPRTILFAIGLSVFGVLITAGLTAAIIILACGLIATLIFLQNKPALSWLIFFKGRKNIFFLMALLVILLFGLAGIHLGVIILGLVFISSGVFITQSATISYIAVHVKEGRSLATGLYYTAYYFGGTVGSWVCGIAYSKNDWHGVIFTLLAVQCISLLITYLFLYRYSLKSELK